MTAVLEISLFGGMRIVADGRLVTTLYAPRTQLLLAYLLLHREAPQARQHLAFLFWPDSSEAQSRTNLRRELHRLRQDLPEADRYLGMAGPALWWQGGTAVDLDVARFEDCVAAAELAEASGDQAGLVAAARQAVSTYRGDLLSGFYDDWVTEVRDRMRGQCVSVLDLLIRVLAETGDVGAAVAQARRRVVLEPLEEFGYATLIELEGRAGDRAAAVKAFHQCASMLERELDADPSPETVAAYERVLSGARRPGAGEPPPEPRAAAHLVGRRREQDVLSAAWRASGARFAALQGEAGIGKSRLADWLCQSVQRSGSPVAVARCVATDQLVALSPLGAWFRHPALAAAVRGLDEPWQSHAASLTGNPDAAPPRAALSDPLSSAWHRTRLFEALARAVAALPQRTLLFLDDLQWCDAETLDWLAFLFRSVPGAPVLVLTAVRVEELAERSQITTTLQILRSLGSVTDIDLAPLSAEEAAELAGRTLGRPLDTDQAARLYQATGGFPLFVVEGATLWTDLDRNGQLPSTVVHGLPARARAVLEGRLAPLAPATRGLLELAAVVGPDFSLELLAESSDLDETAMVAGIDELWRRRLVRASGPGSYDVSHDLIREALLEELSPPRKWLLHRRAAQALELRQRGAQGVAARIAFHYEQAGQYDRAARFALVAASEAAHVFAGGEAVQQYQHALDLLVRLPESLERDRLELDARFQLVAPLNAMEGYASALLQQDLERAVDLATRLGEGTILTQCLIGLWAGSFVQGTIRRSVELARRALDLARHDPRLAAQAEMALGGSLTSQGSPREGIEHFDRATQLDTRGEGRATVFGFRPAVMALAWRAHGLWLIGRSEEAASSAREAVRVAEDLHHPYSQTVAHAYAAVTCQMRGDREGVQAHAASAAGLCQRFGFGYYHDWATILRGWAGGRGEDLHRMRAALARLHDANADSRRPYYLGLVAEVQIRLGHRQEAAETLAEALAAARRNHDRWWEPEVVRLQATLGPAGKRRAGLESALGLARTQRSVALAARAQEALDTFDATEAGPTR
jgi:DNA-binding SARP family transcriptional activator/tetratricopeptide (TPR) repeat protein